ncbi:MAG: transcriptional repressor, partial [candidate division Zixibacteria bacterium]|nr:transcriptional repressor [candidate division Zixibacteria bacterium]
ELSGRPYSNPHFSQLYPLPLRIKYKLRLNLNYKRMKKEAEIFEKYLKTKDLSLTRERKAILNQVFAIDGHLEADDIFLRLRKAKKDVSRATVYRTLGLLVDSGLVRKVYLGEDHIHYEHTFGHTHHDHLVCIKCGKVFEFSDKKIERLQEKICQKKGFKEVSHTVQIFGYCKDCR